MSHGTAFHVIESSLSVLVDLDTWHGTPCFHCACSDGITKRANKVTIDRCTRMNAFTCIIVLFARIMYHTLSDDMQNISKSHPHHDARSLGAEHLALKLATASQIFESTIQADQSRLELLRSNLDNIR